ncbi:MAG TPA: YdcF family protein [Candidatus Paceibacterota bacterium]
MNEENENEIDRLAKILWDYNHLNQTLKKADAVLVLGSYNPLVAERGIDLYFEGYAPYIIFSGNVGRFTRGVFKKPEAEVFADIARERGVPESAIIIENTSTNTGENISFTKLLIEKMGLEIGSFIVVQKPYMERRAYAAFKKLWPEKEVTVTSPQCSYEKYVEMTPGFKERILNSMVADTQKIKLYAEKGFQISQEMPDRVWRASERLVQLGFSKHLVK